MNTKNRELHIAFVTPSLSIGGRERVLSHLINYFSKKNEATIHLILFGKSREIHFEINDNVRIHRPQFSFSSYPKVISTIKTLLYLRNTLKHLNIDILVSFEEIWNRFVLLASFGLRIKKVISNRNNPYRDYGFLDRKLAKFLYPQADLLIAQTNIAKSTYEKRYKLKECIVIGNPIKAIDTNNYSERENIIISIGRLMTSKNHDRLIKIFSNVVCDNWKLFIVGGDFANHNNQVKLTDLIKKLELEDKVILLGEKKDVNSYLLRSKIFAFTSEKEGFPNAIGEAMQAELPVVSYDCIAGPSEMIDDGLNGFLIPIYDDNLFVEKLSLLMHHDDIRKDMGREAKLKISQFDSDIICQNFYDVILKILKS